MRFGRRVACKECGCRGLGDSLRSGVGLLDLQLQGFRAGGPKVGDLESPLFMGFRV